MHYTECSKRKLIKKLIKNVLDYILYIVKTYFLNLNIIDNYVLKFKINITKLNRVKIK